MNFLNKKIFSRFIKPANPSSFFKKLALLSVLFFVSLYINFMFIFQPVKGKKWLSKIYSPASQQTLQKVDGPLMESNIDIRVLKVRHKDKIYLEFLSKQDNGSYLAINSLELKGSREAYFDYWGEMTSLLLLDDDGDGHLDVIAPTFDKFFRPQINLAVYNQETKQFELKPQAKPPKVIPQSSNNN